MGWERARRLPAVDWSKTVEFLAPQLNQTFLASLPRSGLVSTAADRLRLSGAWAALKHSAARRAARRMPLLSVVPGAKRTWRPLAVPTWSAAPAAQVSQLSPLQAGECLDSVRRRAARRTVVARLMAIVLEGSA
jgi:hypothetical protein